MSGNWEVVGKNKKDKQSGKSKKLSKIEVQRFADNAPKVEDLLPLAQVKTLYSALDTNKGVQKPDKTTKTKENETKKAQKKSKEKKDSNVNNTNKPPPKTIEAAVAMITVTEVESVLEVGKQRFPEAPLVWLKGLASWLNTKMPVDQTDNAFTAKSWEYPLCALTLDIRSVLKKALKEVPNSVVQMFFDYCLTSMANDMTKGSPVTGYKMLVQLLASQQPSVAVSNLAKAADLRHSYQNRPAIGCSVMWALGQAGFKDLPSGLQVWRSIMFPVLELRHYSQFVGDYLKHLLARHSTSKAVTTDLYLEIFDTVRSSSNPQLIAHVQTLQGIVNNALANDQLHITFGPQLSRLNKDLAPSLKTQLLESLTQCLLEDGQSYGEWRQLYTSHLPQSAELLSHLSSSSGTCNMGKNTHHLNETLKTFRVTNEDMIKNKQKAKGLQECSRLCNELLGKVVEIKSSSWRMLSYITLLALAAILTFDIKTHGSFKGSKTGLFLKNTGVLKYLEQAGSRVQGVSLQGYSWCRETLPVYWAKLRPYVASTSEYVSTFTSRVSATAATFWLEKKPLIEQWVSPGLLESLRTVASEVWKVVLQVVYVLGKYLLLAVQWCHQNIFVGDVQKVTFTVFNTTSTVAARALTWLSTDLHRVTLDALHSTQSAAARAFTWFTAHS